MRMIRDVSVALVVVLGLTWKIYKIYRAGSRAAHKSDGTVQASQSYNHGAPYVRDQDVRVAEACYMADTDVKERLDVDDDRFKVAEKQGKIVTFHAGTRARIVQFEDELA